MLKHRFITMRPVLQLIRYFLSENGIKRKQAFKLNLKRLDFSGLIGWSFKGLNLGLPDYESGALTN